MTGILLEVIAAEQADVEVIAVPGVTAASAAAAILGDRIAAYRTPDTPVGIVRNAGRPDQTAWFTTLSKLKEEPVDMFCVVLIGNSQTYLKNGKMITPRGYNV